MTERTAYKRIICYLFHWYADWYPGGIGRKCKICGLHWGVKP